MISTTVQLEEDRIATSLQLHLKQAVPDADIQVYRSELHLSYDPQYATLVGESLETYLLSLESYSAAASAIKVR